MPLVQNENMKIYRRPRAWIMIGIVIAIMILFVVFEKVNAPKMAEGDEGYKQRLEQRIEGIRSSLNNTEFLPSDSYKTSLENDLKIYEHALAHEQDITKNTLWGTVLNSASLMQILTIFTIVIAADIVAGEFSGGTIKLLLIRPVKRWKILLSKYAATLLYAVFGLLVLLVSSIIIGAIAYGFAGISIPHLYIQDGAVQERSMLVQALVNYGYNSVSLVMMVTLAFMISSAFRSSSMSIGFSIGLMFMGELIVALLQKYDWVKFFLFSNLNLRQYSPGQTPVVEGMTLGFSVVMLVLYFVAFNAVAWGLFVKRDVAA
jgi:ABC-2 type transport system permease protein